MGVPDSCLSVAAAAVRRSSATLARGPIVRCRALALVRFSKRCDFRRRGPAGAVSSDARSQPSAAVGAAARSGVSPGGRVSPSTQARRETRFLSQVKRGERCVCPTLSSLESQRRFHESSGFWVPERSKPDASPERRRVLGRDPRDARGSKHTSQHTSNSKMCPQQLGHFSPVAPVQGPETLGSSAYGPAVP